MRTRFGLILNSITTSERIYRIMARTKFYPIRLAEPHPYNAQLARCFLKGLSLQKATEIIQLIKYPFTLFNLSNFPKGCVPIFSTLTQTIPAHHLSKPCAGNEGKRVRAY